MKFLFNVLAACFVALCSFGQNVPSADNFDYIVEEVKLPGGQLGNNVDAIVQGPDGFLWFGTHGGLHRFDGYEFVTYKNDPADTVGETTSLSFPYVENLYWDKAGFLWVCTYGGGLYRFDPSTETFKHFGHNPKDSSSISDSYVTGAIEDVQGNLWVSTEKGLNRLDRKTETFTRYQANPKDAKALFNEDIRTLYVDKAGVLWLGTGFTFFTAEVGSLTRYNRDTDSFTNYLYDPKDDQSLWGNSVRGILEDSQGNFWVAAHEGLCRFDRATGKFERMNRDRTKPHATGAFDNTISVPYSIHEDKKGGLWVGSLYNLDRTSTLLRFDLATKEKQVVPVPISAWGLLESSDGTLWISGAGIGGRVVKVYPKAKTYNLEGADFIFTAFLKSDLYKKLNESGTPRLYLDDMVIDTTRGVTWVEGLVEGPHRSQIVLASYDQAHKRTSFYSLEDIKLERNPNSEASVWAAHGMAIDSAGGVWGVVGSDVAAIYRFDPETKILRQHLSIPGDPTSLSSNNVAKIMMDTRGEIWAATVQAGLNRMNPATGKVKRYHFNDANEQFNFPVDIMEDREGKIWTGGKFTNYETGGSFLVEIDPGTDEVRRINLPNRNSVMTVTNLAQSPLHENIYFSTLEGEMGIYYPSTHNFIFVNALSGVTDLECDSKGFIWVALQRSFLRLDKDLNSFAFRDRLGTNLQTRSGLSGADGHIYFMTRTGGWIEVDPDSITPDKTIDDVSINLVDLLVQGEKVKPRQGSFLPAPVGTLDEITFPSNIGSFLFRFSDFDFQNVTPLFQYRLYPFETEWTKVALSPVANYYQVPPGTYTLQIQSLRLDGLKQIAIRELKVVILPPWWRTWWAYSVYGVFFIGLVGTTHRVQRARVISAERERTRDRELAQAKEIEKAYAELKTTQAQLIQSEKMASLGELTAGIAHEIQNPLNFVNNFSEISNELLDEMKTELATGNWVQAAEIANNVKQNLEKILHHGKRADAIVKGMLQHSRSSSGQKELTDINALCDEYLRLSYHGLRAKDKSFNAKFETHFDASLPRIHIVPQDMGRVILNLINNAFYAVSEKSKGRTDYQPAVTVSTRKAGDKVLIAIKDNGNGIPDAIKGKIFQPFFTTKPTGQGTGLGLSLSYDVVKAHDGKLKVETHAGEGSEFFIELPGV